MSKLYQIERALKETDGATFQALCDTYLKMRGYGSINRIGSVVGKKKTKVGTPDTYITLPNGNFIFAEYTTQENDLYEKLKNDVSKCLNEQKTGVPIDTIERIILCHNGKIEASEEYHLRQICITNMCALEIFGLDTLSLDLYHKFPVLAKEHLNIELDTGQVLSIKDFIKGYNKNLLATSLATQFQFRKDELKEALTAFRDTELLVITGKPGVGKTRFAIEVAKRFKKKNNSFENYCIFNKDISLIEDLKAYFPPMGNFIILIDDANRIVEVEAILRLLHGNNSKQRIKIILTVRDYALVKIRERIRSFAHHIEMRIEKFDKKELDALLKSEFGIQHSAYTERIWRISEGNPRLGMMAGKLVQEQKSFDSIMDVSSLYDEYFSLIVQDLNLNDKILLKAAGIISLFRFIDRTNDQLVITIAEAFGITFEELWTSIIKLHELEIVDLHDDEVAKISDQVLSTYLWYKAFIKDTVLDFSVVLDIYLADGIIWLSDSKLKDALYPVLTAFDQQLILDKIRGSVERKWELIKHDEHKALAFMNVFWFLQETKTLQYLNQRIESIEVKDINFSEIKFVPDNNSTQDPYLRILEDFNHGSIENFIIALEIIIKYVKRNQTLVPQFMRILTEQFSFNRNSYYESYKRQNHLISKLIAESKDRQEGALFTQILLGVSKHFLEMQYRDNWTEDHGMTMTSVSFFLQPSKELFLLRRELWNYLFVVYAEPDLQNNVLSIISAYSQKWNGDIILEIAQFDNQLLLPFIETCLNPDIYLHCLIVQDYLKYLERASIPFKHKMKDRFKNEAYEIAQLFDNRDDIREMGYDEFQKYQVKQLKCYFASYTLKDYQRFLAHCGEIISVGSADNNYSFYNGISEVFFNLNELDKGLFEEVFAYMLKSGNPIDFCDSNIIRQMHSCYENKRSFYDVLKQYNYLRRESYLLHFISIEGEENANEYYLKELLQIYRSAPLENIPKNFDFLASYETLDKEIIATVVRTIYERACEENVLANFSCLFGGITKTSQRLGAIFQNHVELLKTVYLNQRKSGSYDYNGNSFIQIMDMDTKFIYEYIDWMFDNHQYLSHHDDSMDYTFLWLRDDYHDILFRITDYIYAKERRLYGSYVGAFYIRHSHEDSSKLIDDKKFEVLSAYIHRYANDQKRMQYIFQMISNVLGACRKDLLKVFLSHNKEVSDFKTLPLESSIMTATGSFVPAFEAKIKFYESLLPLVSADLGLLNHKENVEQRIMSLRRNIEEEKKRNFMES